MSKSSATLLALSLVAFVAACAKQEDVVVVDDPVTTEPVFTGKYK